MLNFLMLALGFLQVRVLTKVYNRTTALQRRRLAAVDFLQKLFTGK